MNAAKIRLLEKQLMQYGSLNESERFFIDRSFPVIYGVTKDITSQPNRIQPAMSDISGEALINEEVRPEDIKVIYVPEKFFPFGLKGMTEALGIVYPAPTLQICIVHLICSSLDFANWKDRKKHWPQLSNRSIPTWKPN